jgi:MYXO-CTERM domain-containing protein
VPIACRSVYVPGIAALCALLGFPGASEAHFVLTSPPAVFEQNALGDPQKAPPCGDAGMAVATGVVTSYQGGETITVTIEETIFHPGHYRIALALDDGVFPDEPPVTPGATPCGSAPIDLTPAFPVLADGVWEHTEPFAGSQSIDITLPDDVSCTNCTLQVIQFMSNHALNDPGGCYYHHCAAIAVDGDPGVTTTSPGDDSSGGSSSDGPPPVTTAADDTVGGGDTSGGVGEDSGSTGAATGVVSNTDSSEVPMDDGDDGGGCSCSLPRADSDASGPLGMLLGLLGIAGLRFRRRGSGLTV